MSRITFSMAAAAAAACMYTGVGSPVLGVPSLCARLSRLSPVLFVISGITQGGGPVTTVGITVCRPAKKNERRTCSSKRSTAKINSVTDIVGHEELSYISVLCGSQVCITLRARNLARALFGVTLLIAPADTGHGPGGQRADREVSSLETVARRLRIMLFRPPNP